MSANAEKLALYNFWNAKCVDLLQQRNNLNRDELLYLAEKCSKFNDEKLKSCIVKLVGWDDSDRAELETFCAIALELMKSASPSRVRDAARNVELKFYLKNI